MAQTLPRETLNLWGNSGASSNFAQFGSQAAGTPIKSKSIATIQGNSAWNAGWQSAVAAGEAPYLEDMNGLLYVFGYEIAYTLFEGVPEWDAGTTYNKGSVVKVPYSGSATAWAFFVSRTDANSNNALPASPASNTNWEFIYQITTGSGLIIPRTTTNDDAPSAAAGYYLEATIGNTSISASVTWQDILTLSLTAGDWDIAAVIGCGQNTAVTHTGFSGAVSLDSGASPGDLVAGKNLISGLPPTSITDVAVSIPKWRVKLASPATIYMKVKSTFASGNPNGYGGIFARSPR